MAGTLPIARIKVAAGDLESCQAKEGVAVLNYPPVITETCKYCGQSATLERQGDGQPFHGKLNYWYETDHMCAEARQTIHEQESGREMLAAILGGLAVGPRSALDGDINEQSADRSTDRADAAAAPSPQYKGVCSLTPNFDGGFTMIDNSFQLTEEERQYLVTLLETDLGETRVEARHTDTPAYLDRVRHQEVVVRELLDKLRSASSVAPTLPR